MYKIKHAHFGDYYFLLVYAPIMYSFAGYEQYFTLFTTLEKGYGYCFAELPRLRTLLYGLAVSVIQVIVAVKK